MLRSFDYAAASAIMAGGAGQSGIALARKRVIIERFRQVSVDGFLCAYTEASQGLLGGTATPQTRATLLNLFLLQKVGYEMAYEAAHRPSWLGVPLRGLAAISARLIGDPGKA
jgi:maltose alpha-D-glucosyltransferase/alpha-amylase